ncbi:PREDICTED: fatty-acid amide hydrolase 2-B-like [Dinoponera quadriceps]|uniref:Fatty-acid amide hydrolase 2-B-like n=1 Tax=Dinoponera quadriceps TaxID=609295 RepID=A0A6P3XMU1_DINQU|nr:PREDICTED: fatty-acid amide hydrolase 2-B-like [Dinoponera quadriceps]
MIKAIFGQSHHTMSLLYVALLDHVGHRIYSGKEMLRYYSQGFKEFQQKLQKLLGKNGVLIYPTFRNTAPFPELAFGELPNIVLYSSLVNVLGFPAVQIPMGLNSKGMPMGLQVIAAPYQDRLCLAVAKELETAFGGWVPPSISATNN